MADYKQRWFLNPSHFYAVSINQDIHEPKDRVYRAHGRQKSQPAFVPHTYIIAISVQQPDKAAKGHPGDGR
jgi:hypothetical protein